MLHFRIPQILLIHFNPFTASTLGRILEHWRKEGVQFVSLEDALAQPIYRFDPKSYHRDGAPFLDQVAKLLGINFAEDTNNDYRPAHLTEIGPPPTTAKAATP